jgi:hypothetical protein
VRRRFSPPLPLVASEASGRTILRGRPRFFIFTSVHCSGLPSDTQRLHGRLLFDQAPCLVSHRHLRTHATSDVWCLEGRRWNLSHAVWAERHAPQALAVLACAVCILNSLSSISSSMTYLPSNVYQKKKKKSFEAALVPLVADSLAW